MTDDFDVKYKKVSPRIKVLSKIQPFLSFTAAVRICEMMIEPLFIYSSTLHLKLSSTHISRLCNVERRAKHTIRQNYRPKSIENNMKKQACLLMKKCLANNFCENFDSYFILNLHEKNTRNEGYFVETAKN